MVIELTRYNKTLLLARRKFNGTIIMKLRAAKKMTNVVYGTFANSYLDSSSMRLLKELDEIRQPWMRYFVPSGQYDDDYERDIYKKECKQLNEIRLIHYETPLVSLHQQLLQSVYSTIENGARYKQTASDIIHNLYVDQEWMCNQFDDYLDANTDLEYELEHNFTGRQDTCYDPQGDFVRHRRKHRVHAETLTKILDILKKPAVPEEVVRFILNPHVTSASYFDRGEMKIRFHINILPEGMQTSVIDQILGERQEQFMSPSDPRLQDIYFLNDVQLYQNWADKIGRDERKIPSQPRKGEKIVAPEQEDTSPEHEVEPEEEEDLDFTIPEGSGDPKDEDDEQPEANMHMGDDDDDAPLHTPPPPRTPSPVSSGIPDDSGYQPDPRLVQRTNMWIKQFKAFTEQEDIDRHDHMTRFNTTSEGPMAVHPSQLKPWDYRIRTGNSGFDPMVMITFTRMSKKPIFNPVM